MSNVPKAVQKSLQLRDSYRQTFSSEHGKAVLNDLIKTYFIHSPIGEGIEETKINVGMQEVVRRILKKAFVNDREFEKAVRESYEQINHTNE